MTTKRVRHTKSELYDELHRARSRVAALEFDLTNSERRTAAIETAYDVLHEKWLSAGHRRDMNEAMDSLALALGRLSHRAIELRCPKCGLYTLTPRRPEDPPEADGFRLRVGNTTEQTATRGERWK